jgi:hypothetical protein
MNWKHFVFCGCILLSIAAISLAEDGFTPLFDGKSLDGWKPLPGGRWEVVEGAIVGTQEATESRHGQLLSDKQYGDFIVRLKFKALAGNSGLYFRVQQVDHDVAVKGFQAEIDAGGNDIGGLYETLGRAWVVQPEQDAVKTYYKPMQWNEMTVTARGGNVTVDVNGVKSAELKDDPGARRGHLGLQLHGGQKMHVMFKEIEIKEL